MTGVRSLSTCKTARVLARLSIACVLGPALVGCGGDGQRSDDARPIVAPAPSVGITSEPAEISPSPSTVPSPSTALAADVDPAATVAEDEFGAITYDLPGCPDAPRAAVADKADQRYWLCMNGQAVTDEIPMTTASSNYGLPPVGTHEVFARDENAWGVNGEPLERFIAFYTTPKGNRIAFHEVVDQDPATVGDLDQRGASAGCFRVREDHSIQMWQFLQIGDPVAVISG